jgi:hypothetical protein
MAEIDELKLADTILVMQYDRVIVLRRFAGTEITFLRPGNMVRGAWPSALFPSTGYVTEHRAYKC